MLFRSGNNIYGQLNVPAGLSGVTAIGGGGAHIVALKSDGTVVAWGDNSAGQTTVPAGLSGVMAIAKGPAAGHTVALIGSAADLIAGLVNLVSSLNLQNGIANSLDAKLQALQASLAATKAHDLNTACNHIRAFINDVTAQSGNHLTVNQANQLLLQAAQIKTALGCS